MRHKCGRHYLVRDSAATVQISRLSGCRHARERGCSSHPNDPCCAQRKEAISCAPSLSCDESETIPKANESAELPVPAVHVLRNSSTSFGIMQPYPDGGCEAVPEFPCSPPQLFSPCKDNTAAQQKDQCKCACVRTRPRVSASLFNNASLAW